MGEPPPSELRGDWIGWSLRHQLRPLVMAAIIRACDGKPPRLPLRQGDLPTGINLRPSDLRIVTEPEPGGAAMKRWIEDAARSGFAIHTPCESAWLRRFWGEMEDPPAALYIHGRVHEVDEPAVAIVGSRHPSDNGLSIARSLARDLAADGVVIVSGLALGIDGAAHRGALDIAGRTVAVLAGGVDRPSPPSHEILAGKIARTGALVSEFPPGVDPRPLHFPRRNRILAALASVVIVVEGRARSGARSTVDHALALGRDVAAIPRDPVHEGSALPNSLIRSGAVPVTSARDVTEILAARTDLRWTRPDPAASDGTAPSPDGLEPEVQGSQTPEDAILRALESGTRSLESLAGRSRMPAHLVLSCLARLELKGRIRRMPGMCFARVGNNG